MIIIKALPSSIIQEMLEVWEYAELFTRNDILDILYNLGDCIKKDSSLGQGILNEIENIRLTQNKCPKCSEKLNNTYLINNISEAWGKNVSEKNTYFDCRVCGWSNKNE